MESIVTFLHYDNTYSHGETIIRGVNLIDGEAVQVHGRSTHEINNEFIKTKQFLNWHEQKLQKHKLYQMNTVPTSGWREGTPKQALPVWIRFFKQYWSGFNETQFIAQYATIFGLEMEPDVITELI